MGQLPVPSLFCAGPQGQLGSSCPTALVLLQPELSVLRLGSHTLLKGQKQGPAPLCVTPPGAGGPRAGPSLPACSRPAPPPAPPPASALSAPPGPASPVREQERERAGGSMVSLQDALLFELSIKSLLKAWSGGGGGE